jgi:Lrp/AsnC family transcriptional regulator, leucine-responsive regulatory protein
MAGLDETDRRILAILQDNARTSNAEISRRIGLAPSAVYERIRKMEERGTILRYEARVDPKAAGMGLLAFVFIKSRVGVWRADVGSQIRDIPGVQEVHHIAGEDCFVVKVRVPDAEALGRLLQERFHAIEAIEGTRTTIVLGTVHETSALTAGLPRIGAVDA